VNLCQSTIEHCHREGSCSMEFVWAKAQDALIKVLRDTKLADAYRPEKYPFTPAGTFAALKEKASAGA